MQLGAALLPSLAAPAQHGVVEGLASVGVGLGSVGIGIDTASALAAGGGAGGAGGLGAGAQTLEGRIRVWQRRTLLADC